MFIAEIGINHNGNIDIAKELILMAKRSGADVVKFQKRNIEENILPQYINTYRKTLNGIVPYIEYKTELEFNYEQYCEIDKFCKENNILWTASIWDINSIDFISQFNIPFIKVPSARLNETSLLKYLSTKDIPVIISIGMSTEEEVRNAISILKDNVCGIMYCKSIYPPKESDLNLSVISNLVKIYPNYKIGYSSHDLSFLPIICASALGAEIFEIHITLNKNMIGSDQKCSFEENDLAVAIDFVKRSKTWLGDKEIKCLDAEEDSKKRLRRFI